MDQELSEVNIYIDTSIKGPKRGEGAYLYLLEARLKTGQNADAWKYVIRPETTENQLAVYALEEALGRLNRPCRLTIWTECPYMAAVLDNGWLDGWEARGWVNAKGEPVADEEKWRRIQYLLRAHDHQVKLKEHHAYRDWMRREIQEREKQKAAKK